MVRSFGDEIFQVTDCGGFRICAVNADTQEPEGNCDMAILKEVSVNGGAFVDANTSPDAVNAVIGDTVTWRITVTNESTGDYGSPLFTVWISDVLPAGFNLESAVPSDGSFSSNTWELPLITEVGEGFFSNLPAVLTLTTTATATGLSENVAAFSEYDGCGDDCVGPYADDESDNNSDSAWVNISEESRRRDVDRLQGRITRLPLHALSHTSYRAVVGDSSSGIRH